jgi:hypothetical protein
MSAPVRHANPAYSKLHRAMFCPQCKAEYRQGIAECADCQVPLVSSLPEAQESLLDTTSAGPLVPLWEGEDLALHTSLLETLDEAGIRYLSRPLGIFPGARRWDPYPIQPMTRFGYQVAVLASSLPRARAILKKLLDAEPMDAELPEQNDVVETIPQARADAEEGPTWELWAGADDEFARFLHDALRENQILLRAESVGAENRVFIRPSDASRGKEILRELTQGAPPQ